jgi:hypothetical protein
MCGCHNPDYQVRTPPRALRRVGLSGAAPNFAEKPEPDILVVLILIVENEIQPCHESPPDARLWVGYKIASHNWCSRRSKPLMSIIHATRMPPRGFDTYLTFHNPRHQCRNSSEIHSKPKCVPLGFRPTLLADLVGFNPTNKVGLFSGRPTIRFAGVGRQYREKRESANFIDFLVAYVTIRYKEQHFSKMQGL